MTELLLSRDAFREAVFRRDQHRCVACGAPAVDAHHILERRLFPDGGYYLSNGASVCGECHLLAEQTLLSVEDLRSACEITRPTIPGHLYPNDRYDKWGNPILDDDSRLRGELFDDPSVQKALAPVLHLFSPLTKYPRTYHLPWSPGATSDDKVLSDLSCFTGRNVVVTEKLDGENTSLYYDRFHARSMDGQPHPSQSWAKRFWAEHVQYQIPYSYRIVGENCYAVHSIFYKDLRTYFYGFGVWDGNWCLAWDETVEWFGLLDIEPVPVLFHGPFEEFAAQSRAFDPPPGREGYVVRYDGQFHARNFHQSVAKYVRPNHVTSHKHWREWDGSTNKLAP